MNRIGFDIGGESDQKEPQVGHADSYPQDEDESMLTGEMVYLMLINFFKVYGLLTLAKDIIIFFRKE